jgi:hypothetical protein
VNFGTEGKWGLTPPTKRGAIVLVAILLRERGQTPFSFRPEILAALLVSTENVKLFLRSAQASAMQQRPLNDTDPTLRALTIQGYRKMSPTEKLDCVRRLTLAVQELPLADVRRRHPAASARCVWRLAGENPWNVRTAGY